MPDTVPTGSLNAASSNVESSEPRLNQPRSPPDEAVPGSSERFCAIEAKFWDHFCGAVGRDDLRGGHRRDLVVDFAAGDDDLRTELQAIFHGHTLAEWMTIAAEHDIALGPSLPFAKVRDDPHLQSRRMVVTEDHPVLGPLDTVGNPIQVDGVAFAVRSAPAHGQHTDEVLATLGYDDGARAGLRRAGVIA